MTVLADPERPCRPSRHRRGSPRSGDLVGLGIGQPCLTFDKWRLIPVVDGETRITGAVTTVF